jgi:peroxiredoxin
MKEALLVSSIASWILLGLNIWATITLIRIIKGVNQRLDEMQAKGLQIGEIAPQFTATDLSGKAITLDCYTRKTIVFIFSIPECEHCQKAIPALNKIWENTRNSEVEIVSVIAAEESDSRKFIDQFQIQIPVLTTTSKADSFIAKYKIFVFPSYCVIDSQRKVQATGIVGDTGWNRIVKQWECKKALTV